MYTLSNVCASFVMMLGNAAKHIAKHFSELEPLPKIEESKNRQLEMLTREKKNLQFLMKMAGKKQKMIAQAQVTQHKIMESYKSLCDGKDMDIDGKEHFKTTSLNIANTSLQLAMSTFEMAADIETRCVPSAMRPQGTDQVATEGKRTGLLARDKDLHSDDCAFV